MNMNYLTIAEEKIPNTQVLINLISYRTRQLNNGARPMVKRDHAEMDNHDIVLKEIDDTSKLLRWYYRAKDQIRIDVGVMLLMLEYAQLS